MRIPRVLVPAVAALVLGSAPAVADADTVWLCRPGADPNPCAVSLRTTVKHPTKPPRVRTPKVAARQPIDCFYVYPTVSEQQNPVSDLAVEPAQSAIALYQAARFRQVCEVYAPMYRQITLRALFGTPVTAEDRELGYADVVAAFDRFRAENPGRGFVLIGHSQGASVLKRLIRERIDPDEQLRSSMVSALLFGTSVAVPVGKTVGGDFSAIPVCSRVRQVNCVITYASFGEKPPDSSLFGRVRTFPGGTPLPPGVRYEAACTNPAALKGGWSPIETIQPSKPIPGLLGAAARVLYKGKPPAARTPWLTPKDRYRAACVRSNGAHVLLVKGIGDARRLYGAPTPGWGLHLMDVNLPLGDLIDVVRAQSRVYREG